MTGTADDLKPRTGNRITHRLSHAHRRPLVDISPNQQRGNVDGRKQFPGVRSRQRRRHQPKAGGMKIRHDGAKFLSDVISRSVAEHARQIPLHEITGRESGIVQGRLKTWLRDSTVSEPVHPA
jgi:hypothetical protein